MEQLLERQNYRKIDVSLVLLEPKSIFKSM